MNIDERVDLLSELVQSLSKKNAAFVLMLFCLLSTHGKKNQISVLLDHALSEMDINVAAELRGEINSFTPSLAERDEEISTDVLIDEFNSRFNRLKEGMLGLIEQVERLEARTAAMSLALDSMFETNKSPRELLDAYQGNMDKMADTLSPKNIAFYRDEVQRMQNKIISNL